MELLSIYSRANRKGFLVVGALLIVVIAIVDSMTPSLPLGYFYLFPILLMAGFLPRRWIALLVLLCAGLTVLMSRYEMKPAIILFVMASLGFAGTGLFVSEIVLNRQKALEGYCWQTKQHKIFSSPEVFRSLVNQSQDFFQPCKQ